MSTVHTLTTELTNLISQTKRRNVELRQACERSLDVLKSFSGGDERAFFQALSNDKTFLNPFYIACSTRNAKYCASAIQCLQALTNIQALPRDQLGQVLDAFNEATNLGQDLQGKILQCLAPLVQAYQDDINDQLIVSVLQMCSKLQERKNWSVNNAASATFQQITVTLFDKVEAHKNDEKKHSVDIAGQTVDQTPAAYDALRIFIDLCLLLEKQQPLFLRIKELSEAFALELFEIVLVNNGDLFLKYPEFAHHLRVSAVPTFLRFFTEKRDFSVVVRVTRVLYQLLRRELPVLKVECEVILSMLIQCLETRDHNPHWKRVLCSEVFLGICREFKLVQDIYQEYDQVENRRDIIHEMIVTFDKVASEDTKLIGYGPVSMPLYVTTEAEGDLKIRGLSPKSSKARVLCLDSLEKTSAPVFPDSYMHYEILLAINALSDGLAKFVVPKVSEAGSSGSTPNLQPSPLDTSSSESTAFAQQCWPELLSLYKLFLFSTMEDQLFHSTARAVQKLAHASGVLSLISPRDAFMSLLGRCTVTIAHPSKQNQQNNENVIKSPSLGGTSSPQHHQQRQASLSLAGVTSSSSEPSLADAGLFTARNVLCCRALLNLGISLGPQLGTSWTIIIETLQYTDALLRPSRRNSSNNSGFGLGSEFSSVDATLKKLIESFKEYDDAAHTAILQAVCGLERLAIGTALTGDSDGDANQKIEISGIGDPTEADPCFLLDLLGEIGKNIVSKLSDRNWQFLVQFLVSIMASRTVENSEARIRAGTILNNISYQAMVESDRETHLQQRILESLHDAVQKIVALELPEDGSVAIIATESEIHVSVIDNIVRILDHCGGKLMSGWKTVLQITESVFNWSSNPQDLANETPRVREDRSGSLIKSGFEITQLVCNDFLQSLPVDDFCLLKLVDILFTFCNGQDRDLNISFSAISFFWIVCDHLRSLAAESDNKSGDKLDVENEEALWKLAQSVNPAKKSENSMSIYAIWMIALLRLTTISQDNRHPQVRTGAVQIMFRILNSHGGKLPLRVWQSCQVVVVPTIMKIRPPKDLEILNDEWVETMSLILGGVTGLYALFSKMFVQQQENFPRLWTQLLEYLESCNKYQLSPPVLSPAVYKGLETVLQAFGSNNGTKSTNEEGSESSVDAKLPENCLQQVWDFWTRCSDPEIVDNHSDPKIVQEALTGLVNLHEVLYRNSPPAMIESNITSIVSVLEKCTSYNELPQLYSDKDHLSPLQAAGLKQISRINIEQSACICSVVLRLISNLVRIPFITIGGEHRKPTYITLCERSLKLLLSKLDLAEKYFAQLVENGTAAEVLSAVLVPMKQKFACPILKIGDNDDHSVQLWQLGTTVLTEMTRHTVSCKSSNDQLWKLILQGVVSVLASTPSGNELELDQNYEQFDVRMYKTEISTIGDNAPSWVYDTLVENLYLYSLMYDTSLHWKPRLEDVLASTESNSRSARGSTLERPVMPRQNIAYMCLDELARLGNKGNASSWLNLRAANVLLQYVTDCPLRGKMPMRNMVRNELIHTLKIHQGRDTKALYPLIVKALTVATGDKQIMGLLQSLL